MRSRRPLVSWDVVSKWESALCWRACGVDICWCSRVDLVGLRGRDTSEGEGGEGTLIDISWKTSGISGLRQM